MGFRIDETATGIEIHVSYSAALTNDILEELTECARGCLKCPASKTADFDTLQVSVFPAEVVIHLDTRAGQTLNIPAIERCLAHKVSTKMNATPSR